MYTNPLKMRHLACIHPCSIIYKSLFTNFMNRQLLIDNLEQEYKKYLFTDGIIEQPSISELGVINLHFEFPNGWIIGHKIQTMPIDNNLVGMITNFYHNIGVDLTWWFAGDELKTHFDTEEFVNGYVCRSGILQKLAYLSLGTWGKLSLRRVINSINTQIINHPNVNPSLTSHVDKCVISGTFLKEGAGLDSIIQLSPNHADTDKFKQEGWYVPTKNAIATAKLRSRVK